MTPKGGLPHIKDFSGTETGLSRAGILEVWSNKTIRGCHIPYIVRQRLLLIHYDIDILFSSNDN